MTICPLNSCSWDFRKLCRGANQEYTWEDNTNHTYRWNICGTVAKRCVPQEYPVYVSEGVATQQWTADPPCPSPPAPPGCTDPETNTPICCTGDCTVLAHDIPRYELLDPNNPATGGIVITHAGMPPEYVRSRCFLECGRIFLRGACYALLA